MSATGGGHASQPSPSMGRSSPRRRSTDHSFAWRVLFENFGLKVLSLLVALGFYASMHTASNAQRTLQVPIVADMPARGGSRVLVSELPQTLSVTIEGPRSQLDGLEERLDPIPLNLRDERDDTVRFVASMIAGLPRTARVTRIIPEALDIRWENVVERELEVQAPIAGQLAKGLEIRGEVSLNPRAVKVRGPESTVKAIQLARTEPFEIGGLGEGKFERNLALAAPPAKAVFAQPFVTATLEVAQKLATRELQAKVQVIGLPRGRAEPAVVRVLLSGAPERIGSMRPESVLVRVDPRAAGVDPAKPGTALMPLIVDVLEATATTDPAQVVVRW
ncbi:MAG: YbbR-like domain-containing protein [Deltaproteobacteria bacterium]|nr:YbbR-like domain-containing protein [Deltaproteobacteria bacterium]